MACVHCAAAAALATAGVDDKPAAALKLAAQWQGRLLAPDPACAPPGPCVAARPARPELVAPDRVPRRNPASTEGRAALLHAIAHIEFSAIDLALDCVARFRGLPDEFYGAWADVAAEEARHFALVRSRLQALGCDYGDFPAHDGLWEMARKTADDVLARMALVPRVLEARGLDATPLIMSKLQRMGDEASVAVLEVILREEVGHVALGDRWFRYFCARQGLAPEPAYLHLIGHFAAPWPKAPLNREARLRAGFSAAELDSLAGGPRTAG